MKNPLAAILGYAELLRRRDDEAVRAEAPERIHEAALRLSYVIDDLLTVLALEAGTVALDPLPLELGAAVTTAFDEVASSQGTSHTLRTAPDAASWPWVNGDAHYVSRILANVLLVACRVAPGDSEIFVDVGRRDGRAEVTVSASRLAVAEEELARLVDGDASTTTGGTGLELYKARRLIELHGGALSADAAGGAPTIRFTIPLAEEDEPLVGEREPDQPA